MKKILLLICFTLVSSLSFTNLDWTSFEERLDDYKKAFVEFEPEAEYASYAGSKTKKIYQNTDGRQYYGTTNYYRTSADGIKLDRYLRAYTLLKEKVETNDVMKGMVFGILGALLIVYGSSKDNIFIKPIPNIIKNLLSTFMFCCPSLSVAYHNLSMDETVPYFDLSTEPFEKKDDMFSLYEWETLRRILIANFGSLFGVAAIFGLFGPKKIKFS